MSHPSLQSARHTHWKAQNGTCVCVCGDHRTTTEQLWDISRWRSQIWKFLHTTWQFFVKIKEIFFWQTENSNTHIRFLNHTHAVESYINHEMMPFWICIYTHTHKIVSCRAHSHPKIRRHRTHTKPVFGHSPFGHPSMVQRASSPSSRQRTAASVPV